MASSFENENTSSDRVAPPSDEVVGENQEVADQTSRNDSNNPFINKTILSITSYGHFQSPTNSGASSPPSTSQRSSETDGGRETIEQSNSPRHLSEWNITEVSDWFQSYGLTELHQVLLTPDTTRDGAALEKIFNWKLKNYEQYRDHYKRGLPPNLHKDFDRFGVLLDSFFIDKYTHIFDVAFSFPGDIRDRVRELAEKLCVRINSSNSRRSVFYDEYHNAELARPNLDLYLHDIYRNKTRLIVVFMCADYSLKEWCGLECRAIRSLLLTGQGERIMLLSVDGKTIDGVLNIDGYLDISTMNNNAVIDAIYTRLKALDEPLSPARYPHASTRQLESTRVLPKSVLAWRNALCSLTPWYVVMVLLAYILGTFVGR